MSKKKRCNKIEVTFKDDIAEEELYLRICKSSKFVGKTGWMKEAALEKLDREDNNNIPYNSQEQYVHKQSITQYKKDDIPLAEEGLNNLLSMFN